MKANSQKVKIISVEEFQGGLITIRSDRSIEFSSKFFPISTLIYPDLRKKIYKIKGIEIESSVDKKPEVRCQDKVYGEGDEFLYHADIEVKVFEESSMIFFNQDDLMIEVFHEVDQGAAALIKMGYESKFYFIDDQGYFMELDKKIIADMIQETNPSFLGHIYSILRGL